MIELLTGNTIRSIDISNGEVSFICDEGSFKAYHKQSYSVKFMIYDIKGKKEDIIDSTVLKVDEKVSRNWPSDVNNWYPDSFTWTTYNIVT